MFVVTEPDNLSLASSAMMAILPMVMVAVVFALLRMTGFASRIKNAV